MDALGDAARHLPLQHPLPGLMAEVDVNQRGRHAAERHALDRERDRRHELAQGLQAFLAEARCFDVGGPVGVDRVHLADRPVLVEAIDEGDDIGVSALAQAREHFKIV